MPLRLTEEHAKSLLLSRIQQGEEAPFIYATETPWQAYLFLGLGGALGGALSAFAIRYYILGVTKDRLIAIRVGTTHKEINTTTASIAALTGVKVSVRATAATKPSIWRSARIKLTTPEGKRFNLKAGEKVWGLPHQPENLVKVCATLQGHSAPVP